MECMALIYLVVYDAERHASYKHGCFSPMCASFSYCRRAAWTGLEAWISESGLSQSGHALGCAGATVRGFFFFFIYQANIHSCNIIDIRIPSVLCAVAQRIAYQILIDICVRRRGPCDNSLLGADELR